MEPDIPTRPDDALERALPLAREAAEQYSRAQVSSLEKTAEQFSRALEQGESLFTGGNTEDAARSVFAALDGGMKAGIATEESINALGYSYLNAGKTEMAVVVFTFNVRQFPKSANAYDSLGEALMRAGRIDESILNYRKSVELDPGNDNAKQIIEKMEQQKKAGKK